MQALLVQFIRTAKEKVPTQNWPTFMVYKIKLNALMRGMQRVGVIKDIVIVINQLQIQQLN